MEERKGRVSYVIGPDGSPLTLADLPPPSTRRWVIRRKAEVVAAVRGGLLSLDDACKRYTLTVEEFRPECNSIAINREAVIPGEHRVCDAREGDPEIQRAKRLSPASAAEAARGKGTQRNKRVA